MTSNPWSLVELTAQLLRHDERETVLGDLVEGGETAWQALRGVLGLVIRRQAILWRSWRPWLAAFGLALPGSFLLMGHSLSVSWSYWKFVESEISAKGANGDAGFLLLLGHIALLTAWSWTAGFVVGSVSRRTVWVSTLFCCLPCMFCLERFRASSLPRLCLLLFLVPAIWGAHKGLRMARIKLRAATVLAAVITILMWRGNLWAPDWMLLWPALYLVVTARSCADQPEGGRLPDRRTEDTL